MVSGALSPGVERLGHEADNSHLSSVEVNKDGAMPPFPNISSRQLIKERKKRYLFT
jgi:hypothetical protein